MLAKLRPEVTDDALNRIAGITGLGWTTSFLGYISAVTGYSNNFIPNPQPLLYLGGILLVATLGLDRLRTMLSNRET